MKEDFAPDAELDFSEESLNEIYTLVEGWLTRFEQSPQWQQMPEYTRMVAESAILYFTEYMYTHLGQEPAEWNAQGLEEVCLSVMPAKIATGPDFFNVVPQVLGTFFAFLKEQQLLTQTDALQQHLARIASDIPLRAADESQWSMSKVIAMMALNAGVDLEDEDQVKHFMQMLSTTFEEQAWDQAAQQDGESR
ncbi:MAG: hypothetical protein KF690_11215 [Bacteroidetes bacterium]|nr:hypothetical protein [Bacteroidota bacterium]